MKRRDFLKTTAITAAAASMPINSIFAGSKTNSSEKEIIKPKRLKKGDTLGIISPGSSVNKEELKESIEALEKLGFNTYTTDRICAKHGYLGGTDEQRAADVNEMFANEKVDGIVCARGGYGCNRILGMLDYDVIKKNPKVLIGYSDITALLYGIYAQTGLVTFHGPVGISTFNEFSVDYFTKVLMEPQEQTVFHSAKDDQAKKDEAYHIVKIRGGKASGRLVGGNMAVGVSLMDTPYDVDYTGKLIFFEEIGEKAYRVDRMLSQMTLSGDLSKAAGIVLGVFKNCEDKEDESSFSLKEVLFDRLTDLGIPVIYGLSFGHITNKFTIPFGINAEMNVAEETLTLLEPAVL